jgi:hypothetical protein
MGPLPCKSGPPFFRRIEHHPRLSPLVDVSAPWRGDYFAFAQDAIRSNLKDAEARAEMSPRVALLMAIRDKLALGLREER